MELETVIGLFLKGFVLANLFMVMFALMTWVERRLISFFQNRLGPNRTGPMGLLQPIADLIKLIRKENFQPTSGIGLMHVAAPLITLFFAIMVFAVVPFGDRPFPMGLPFVETGWDVDPDFLPYVAADLPVAVLFAVAMSGLSGYGVIVGGWASNSKFALLASLRACAQLVSYEVSMALAVLPVVMMAGSLSLVDIGNAWKGWELGGLELPFIVWVPVGFLIFLIAAAAEANRAPFDHAEAEQELVAGFHTEYGGLRYAAFANAEYLHLIAISSLGVTFFLGAWHGPFVDDNPWWGVLWFLLKLAVLLFLFVWARATVPRLRYDRLMKLGWKAMLPLATVQFLLTAWVVATGAGREGDQPGRVEAAGDRPASIEASAALPGDEEASHGHP